MKKYQIHLWIIALTIFWVMATVSAQDQAPAPSF